jgi:hypothetical protein
MRRVSAVRAGVAAAFITVGALGAIASGCGSSSNGAGSGGDGGNTSEAGTGNDGQTPPFGSDSGGTPGLGEDSGSDSGIVSGDDDNGDDDSGGNGGDDDSGGNGGDDAGADSGGNTHPDAGFDAGSDGAVDSGPCKQPALHVPTVAGGIYCPYSFNDVTDSGTQHCANGTQECCLSPGGDAGPSVCQTVDGTGVGFNGGLAGCAAKYSAVWQCSSPVDCANAGPILPIDGGAPTSGALVCCMVGGPLEADTSAGICTGVEKTHFGGTTCQPAAACTGTITVGLFTDPLYTVCEQQSDCTGASQTCTPIYVTGTPIGVCLPQ